MQNTGSVFAAIYSLTHSLRLTLQMLVGREMDGETRRGREGVLGGEEEGTLSCLSKTILKRVNTGLRNDIAYNTCTVYKYTYFITEHAVQLEEWPSFTDSY